MSKKIVIELKSTVRINMPGYSDLQWALFRLIIEHKGALIPHWPATAITKQDGNDRYALLEFHEEIKAKDVKEIEEWILQRLCKLEEFIINYNLLLDAGILGLPKKAEDHPDIEDTKIEELGFNTHINRALKHGDINTVGEILDQGEEGIASIRNIGRESVKKIKEKLAILGVELGGTF